MKTFDYNSAIRALNAGGRVRRSAWTAGVYIRHSGQGPVWKFDGGVRTVWYAEPDDETATDWCNYQLFVPSTPEPTPPAPGWEPTPVAKPKPDEEEEESGTTGTNGVTSTQLLLVVVSIIVAMITVHWIQNHSVALPERWHLQLPSHWPTVKEE